MSNLFSKEDLLYVELINKNLHLLKNNYKINESSEILILYNICESIVKLSKKYETNNIIIKDIHKYRQKIAHSKIGLDEIHNYVEKEYLNLIKEFKLKNVNIEDLFDRALDRNYEYIEDKIILDILNTFNRCDTPIYRLTEIPKVTKFEDEHNYLLFYDSESENKCIEEVMNLLNTKLPRTLHMRKFYKIKNNKNTSMEW